MALIQCPECGANISTTAAFCPNCGFRRSALRRPFNACEPLRGWRAILTIVAYVLALGAVLIAYGFSAIFTMVITTILAAIEIRRGLVRRIPLPSPTA